MGICAAVAGCCCVAADESRAAIELGSVIDMVSITGRCGSAAIG